MHKEYTGFEVIFVPNYKEMYLKLFRATEKAIDLLISAQQECEELYLSGTGQELRIIPSGMEEDQDQATPPFKGG